MKIATCSIVKNSHYILREFCEHHLKLGFDKIYLFEDDNSVPLDDIVKDLANVELVKLSDLHIDYKKYYYGENEIVKQEGLYNWFIEQHRNEYDWVAFIDDDEHIQIKDGYNIKDILKKYDHLSALYLYWKTYTSTSVMLDVNKSLPDRSNKVCRLSTVDPYQLKSIVNMKHTSPLYSIHTGDLKGQDLYGTTVEKINTMLYPHDVSNDIAYINHYMFRTFYEWYMLRNFRGDLMDGNRKFHMWFDMNPGIDEYEAMKEISKYV